MMRARAGRFGLQPVHKLASLRENAMESRRSLCHNSVQRKSDGCPMFAPAYSGFPVELACVDDLHAAFLNESRTRGCWWRLVQEIRIHGPKTMGAAPTIAFAKSISELMSVNIRADVP
jgi:hypothetical protein